MESMDCNLPELLARDLELSRPVFVSRHMTAGTPRQTLAKEAPDRHYSLRGDPSSPRFASPRGQSLLARARSMDVVGERGSRAHPARGPHASRGRQPGPSREHHRNGGTRDLVGNDDDSSDDSSSLSEEVEPSSPQGRKQSLVTTATSVTSGWCSSAMSHKPFPSGEKANQASWVDLDSDCIHSSDDNPVVKLARPGLQRPYTSASASVNKDRLSQQSLISINIPRRRSSLGHRASAAKDQPSRSQQPSSATDAHDTGETVTLMPKSHSPSHQPDMAVDPTQPDGDNPVSAPIARKPIPSGAGKAVEDRHDPVADDAEESVPATTSPEKPFPLGYDAKEVESSAALHTWLESIINFDEYDPKPAKIDMAPAGPPLPRQVLDNLHISVANFPDCILLPESFAIETIRAYSRKVRRSHMGGSEDGRSAFSFSAPVPVAAARKRWKLPKLLSSRMAPAANPASSGGASWPAPPSQQAASNAHARAMASLEQPPRPEWSRIQSVFPTGSDYLCRALYAHVVALNYISSQCGPPSVGSRGEARAKAKADDGRQIPAKAAMLLGIPNGRPKDGGIRTTAGSRGRRQPPAAVGATGVGSFSTMRTTELDPSLKRLRQGLADCVGRLVSTLKLTTGQLGDAPLNAEAAREMDPLLMRTLCELVRCCEEPI